jgi:hypothetical protein
MQPDSLEYLPPPLQDLYVQMQDGLVDGLTDRVVAATRLALA